MALSDYPLEQKAFPWKMVLIIALGVLLAIVVVVVVLLIGRKPTQTQTSVVQTPVPVVSSSQTNEQANVVPADPCQNPTDPVVISRCSDDEIALKALIGTDVSICDKMKDTQKQQACKTVVSSQVASCTQETCVLDRVIAVANALLDADVCQALPAIQEARCREHVVLNDPDHDGLDSAQEIMVYHTDPHNPDTDGDGYKDGDEVRTGHDPLKK